GVLERTEECEFTDRFPASTARDTRTARDRSSVQIDPDRPYPVSLASATASCSSSKASTVTTGPKISSVTLRSVRCGVRTVGGNQNPGPDGASPRNATGASSGT